MYWSSDSFTGRRDPARDAHHQHSVRHHKSRRNDRAGRHQAFLSNSCATQQHRSHADQRATTYKDAMNDGAMSDRNVVLDFVGKVRVAMQDGPILHIHPLPNENRRHIAPGHRIEPEAGVPSDGDVAGKGAVAGNKISANGSTEMCHGLMLVDVLAWRDTGPDSCHNSQHHCQEGSSPIMKSSAPQPSLLTRTCGLAIAIAAASGLPCVLAEPGPTTAPNAEVRTDEQQFNEVAAARTRAELALRDLRKLPSIESSTRGERTPSPAHFDFNRAEERWMWSNASRPHNRIRLGSTT